MIEPASWGKQMTAGGKHAPQSASDGEWPLDQFDQGQDIAGIQPFWRVKSLSEMSDGEWESLCDGCARCCLVKLEDGDTGKVHYTDVGCSLLDIGTCRCRDYPNRSARVEDCVRLTPDSLAQIDWLPPTCAYRRLAEGRDLAWWHPLMSGTYETVHSAGISVLGRCVSEQSVDDDDLSGRLVEWPLSPAGSSCD